jgi:hypothetical protein
MWNVGVVPAIEKLNVLDKLLECASIHTETKDVIDSTATMLKLIHKLGKYMLSKFAVLAIMCC